MPQRKEFNTQFSRQFQGPAPHLAALERCALDEWHRARSKGHPHLVSFPFIWVWVKIKPPGDRRFWFMCPFTRIPFWVHVFDHSHSGPQLLGSSGGDGLLLPHPADGSLGRATSLCQHLAAHKANTVVTSRAQHFEECRSDSLAANLVGTKYACTPTAPTVGWGRTGRMG